MGAPNLLAKTSRDPPGLVAVPRSTPRRKKPRTERVARPKKARKPTRSANRRADRGSGSGGKGGGRGKKRRERAPLSVADRKARNRTVLLMTVLGLINAYVFLWQGDGLAGLTAGPAAAIGAGNHGPLPPIADPPQDACTGDAVRIFEGLEDLIYVDTALRRGLTLRLALLQEGIEGTEIDTIESSIRPHVDLGLLGGSGSPVRVAMDRLGGVRALEIELAEGHVLQACRSAQEAEAGFAVRNLQHPLRSDVEVLAFTLGSDADLSAAIEAAGEKPELARLIAARLAADVDFMTEARPDDAITVVVEKRWLGRNFHRYGAMLAVRFHGVATRVAHYLYKPEGQTPDYFDANGKAVRRELLRSPVGYHRVAPGARGMLMPSLEVVEGRVGAAYRLPEGAPLVAVADGEVVEVDRDAERGVFIDVQLDDGTRLRYAHLLRVVGSLEPGSEVRQGQLLGLAGHSGRTPHDRLRLELWEEVDGALETVDPMRLTAKGSARAARVGAPVPEEQHSRYTEDIAPRRRALRVAH